MLPRVTEGWSQIWEDLRSPDSIQASVPSAALSDFLNAHSAVSDFLMSHSL